ncbi:diacylglycerol/lipid kinase family protein [Rothia sp. P6271]|uniref:diacylglycerol/lipid kinase family protein n=1 Tax=Rothia sp. P6271 TaxID=3402659 RepID=UPI003AC94CB3
MNISTRKIVIYSTLALGAGCSVATWAFNMLSRHGGRDVFPIYQPSHVMLSPGEPQKVAVIFNPTKPQAELSCQTIKEQLAQAQWPEALFYETTVEDPGYQVAQKALEHGAQRVIAIGGDGTVREVASALAGSEATLGIVPMGTGNLLARNLNLAYGDVAESVNTALYGTPERVDMIQMKMTHRDQSITERRYIIMGGAGFDAQIMHDTDEKLKTRFGWVAYLQAGLKNLLKPRKSVKITVDDRPPIRRKIRSVLIANCGQVQGGVNLTSTTNAQDGQLEVIILAPRNLSEWIIVGVQFVLGPQIFNKRRRVLEHVVGKSANIKFVREEQPVEIDGDTLPHAIRLQAEVLPGAVKISLYPQESE